jgi:hypothetical protein
MNLTEALEKLQDLRAQTAKPEEAVVLEAAVVSQNKESMKQLRAMMGGIR